jgi:hypothetical protein
MDTVKSSAIKGLQYDPVTGTVYVHFHSGGAHKFGPLSQSAYDSFLKSPSVGKHFHQYVASKAIK